MVFPNPHNYLQVFGTIVSGAYEDIWSFGLRIGKPGEASGTPTGTVATAMLDDIAADLTTFWTGIQTSMPTTTTMTGFKFNGVGVDGKYLSQSETLAYDFPGAGLAGTGATPSLPPQCTVVATLETGQSRGLAAKGRIYLPPFRVTVVENGGVLAETFRLGAEQAVAQLCTDLNNWPGIDAAADPGNVVVASEVREGAMRTVNRVTVGTVIDTQRRRRNGYVEVRGAGTAVAA